MNNNRETMVAEIAEWSAYRLVSEAGCYGPDSLSSEGARMLESVRDATLELIADTASDDLDRINDNGSIDEIADSAPSVYTFTKWTQFVDLGAWNEDIEDYVQGVTDMDKLSSIALYVIAERLANAIVAAVTEAALNDDDTTTDES